MGEGQGGGDVECYQRDCAKNQAVAPCHINNIVTEGELLAESVVKESLTTAADGKAYGTKVYNLDAILAVGCHAALFSAGLRAPAPSSLKF